MLEVSESLCIITIQLSWKSIFKKTQTHIFGNFKAHLKTHRWKNKS